MRIQTTVGAAVLASIIALSGCSSESSDKPAVNSGVPAPTTSVSADAQTTTSAAEASPSATPSIDPESVDGEEGGLRIDPATHVVDGKALAESISAKLAKEFGGRPDSLTCPDLSATVGASVKCTLVNGVDTLMFTVVVTAVNGSSLDYELKSGD